MPYKAFKIDDEFCVYKLDADDERMGEQLGCHATEAEAGAQGPGRVPSNPGHPVTTGPVAAPPARSEAVDTAQGQLPPGAGHAGVACRPGRR